MDEREWTDLPLLKGETLSIGNASVRLIEQAGFVYLVTGNLQAAFASMKLKVPLLGFCDDRAEQPNHAIRIARDNALLVAGKAVKTGWHEPGVAISLAGDLYKILEIDGPDANEVLARCGIADPEMQSPSAAILFASVQALLVRTGEKYETWVPAAYLTYVTGYLRGMTI